MRTGIKLDPGFSESGVYRRLYGSRDILRYLRQTGVEAAEAPIRPDTEERAILEHVRMCSREGLTVSFHPYTERTPFNPESFSPDGENPCRRMHERFFGYFREAARIQKARALVNIHPAAGSRESNRSHLVNQSVRFFEWASRWCSRNAPEVRLIAELQIRARPEEPIQRAGDSYDEILAIAERSGMEACWDFGHAFMNARQFGLPLNPPVELLRRIVHVHCHDADGEDHQPLIHGTVPWKENLKSLSAVGFSGTVILEVPPEHFLASGGIESLEKSMSSLRAFLGSLGGAG